MHMPKEKNKCNVISVIITILLFLFFAFVFYVNFTCNPYYYDSDVYCDIEYAKASWEAKSLFPNNWVFGNQLYVAATPNLAALIYGITKNAVIAMGIASCIMTIITVLAYNYMTKPVFTYNVRMTGFLVMVIPIIQYWRRDHCFFTMASYYSCYIITALIVYGLYIRIRSKAFKKKDIVILICAVAMSIAMGMQSIRQTTIMVMPLVACEILLIIIYSIKDKKFAISMSTAFTFAVLISNLAGLFAVKFIDINQSVALNSVALNFDLAVIKVKIYNELFFKIFTIISIQGLNQYLNYLIVLIVFSVVSAGLLLNAFKLKKRKDISAAICTITLIVLLAFGVICVFFIGILTEFDTAPRYYFMIYPLIAVSFGAIISCLNRAKTQCFIIALIFISSSIVGISYKTYKEIKIGVDESSTSNRMAEYMISNGYKYLYSEYYRDQEGKNSESVAVSSKGEIQAIYFTCDDKIFSPLIRISTVDGYKKADNSKSLYQLRKTDLDLGIETAEALGATLEPVAEFDDIVLCKASDNLLVLEEEKNK